MTASSIPRVVVADPLGSAGVELLRRQVQVIQPADTTDLQRELTDSEALVVRSRTKVTAGLLEQGKNLRLVARAGIGVDNIDVPAATERGILVINAPLGNVRSTAEHTMALIFALARHVVAADRAVRDGTWKTGYEGMQLAGKRLGVIGTGKVGSIVASLAGAMGMEVIAYDPYLPESAWQRLGLQRSSLEELLASSDIITLHVPLSAETRYLLGADQIANLKRGAYLVNCARGGLVDEGALAQALKSGQIGAAALDVFEEEPFPVNSPLLQAPNLLLTPHVAASTKEAQAQVSIDLAEQILDFFDGRPVAFPINPAVLERV